MLSAAAVAFATFFATIGPIDVAFMFVALTGGTSPARRRAMAVRGTAIATVVLLVFAVFGESVLDLLGVTGMHVITRVFGVLLCALAVQFVFDGVMQSGLFGTPG